MIFVNKSIHFCCLFSQLGNNTVDITEPLRIICAHGIGFLGGSADLLAGGRKIVRAVHKRDICIL